MGKLLNVLFWPYLPFSNSLIIHAALTQPEHLILVLIWFEMISNTDANFLNLHIDKATKTCGYKQLYLITHFTKLSLNPNHLLLMLNVTVQLLNYCLNLNSCSMVVTSCFGSLSTLLYTSDLKWH